MLKQFFWKLKKKRTHRCQALKSLKFLAILTAAFFWIHYLLERFVPRIVFSQDRWSKAVDPSVLELILADSPRPALKCLACGDVLKDAKVSTTRSVFRRTGISCEALFKGNEAEQRKAKHYIKITRPETLTPEQLLRMTTDCKTFRTQRGYVLSPLSDDEAQFPIAFSLLVKGDAVQAERLLRAIYAPQNYYCLHVDARASPMTLSAMRGVSSCFNNVFLAPKLEKVYWGHISIMYAEMNCMEALLRYRWKYFINLSGQMLPTRSNRELVQILRLYDGANDVEGTSERSKVVSIRMRNSFHWRLFEPLQLMVPMPSLKDLPPHNLTLYKGTNQVVLTRAFVVYFLYAQPSRDLVEWLVDTMIPDEYVWPTLNHNIHLHAPGSYKGKAEAKACTARYSLWESPSESAEWKCQGKWVRYICIFGVGDLPWIYRRPELFLNKFHADFEWLAYDCMEELIRNRTLEERGQNVTYDLTYYRSLPFVANKTLVTSVEEALKYWK